jgi:hypothetical protein
LEFPEKQKQPREGLFLFGVVREVALVTELAVEDRTVMLGRAKED